LSQSERDLVRGFLINRFRGDKTLLESGIDWLTEKTNVPTLGVLPYLKGLHIEAEDAVDHRSHNDVTKENSQRLKVVVPRIPRISNHTDFDVLRLHPQVDLIFVDEGQVVPAADLIILPGSKNTINDLNWLVDNEWPAQIKKHLRYGGKLIGICGGYQMIGQHIHDPEGIEGKAGSQSGLQLMDFETTLASVKQLTQVTGYLFDSKVRVDGYEIHMGITDGPDLIRPAIDLGDRTDGVISSDDQILCSYLHGLFDYHEACDALLQWAGLDADSSIDYQALRQREIDRVATMLETEINFDLLAANIGLT
jgi:adenosylcobyric acid synthase